MEGIILIVSTILCRLFTAKEKYDELVREEIREIMGEN